MIFHPGAFKTISGNLVEDQGWSGAGPPTCHRCFAGDAVCIPPRQPHRRGLDFHALLTCKPPARGHLAKKAWGQPSLPGNPAPRPTKLADIRSSAHRDKFSAPSLHQEGKPRGAKTLSKYLLVRCQSWTDLTLLTLSVFALPSIMSFRRVKGMSIRAGMRGMKTLRPSVLKFRSRLHHISKHMFLRRRV